MHRDHQIRFLLERKKWNLVDYLKAPNPKPHSWFNFMCITRIGIKIVLGFSFFKNWNQRIFITNKELPKTGLNYVVKIELLALRQTVKCIETSCVLLINCFLWVFLGMYQSRYVSDGYVFFRFGGQWGPVWDMTQKQKDNEWWQGPWNKALQICFSKFEQKFRQWSDIKGQWLGVFGDTKEHQAMLEKCWGCWKTWKDVMLNFV